MLPKLKLNQILSFPLLPEIALCGVAGIAYTWYLPTIFSHIWLSITTVHEVFVSWNF